MKHTAGRLLIYAVNGVIDIRNVKDAPLRRLLKNEQSLPHIRRALKEIDPFLEVLIPYAVDDHELQLKRYIQLKVGVKKGYDPVKINLSTLRKKHYKYYLKLFKYGSPADVIRRWGFTIEYDAWMTESLLVDILRGMADEDGILSFDASTKNLYDNAYKLARKQSKTVAEYLADYGLNYSP